MGWIDIFTQLGKLKWIYELKYINNRCDITATAFESEFEISGQ